MARWRGCWAPRAPCSGFELTAEGQDARGAAAAVAAGGQSSGGADGRGAARDDVCLAAVHGDRVLRRVLRGRLGLPAPHAREARRPELQLRALGARRGRLPLARAALHHWLQNAAGRAGLLRDAGDPAGEGAARDVDGADGQHDVHERRAVLRLLRDPHAVHRQPARRQGARHRGPHLPGHQLGQADLAQAQDQQRGLRALRRVVREVAARLAARAARLHRRRRAPRARALAGRAAQRGRRSLAVPHPIR